MDIYPIYPKVNLSKRMQQAKVCPHLLRNAITDKLNQTWSIDITYIPIRCGFLYLTAIIDWHSRCIMGWEVDDTLGTRMVINALKKAFMVATPQILNSDQGCQFTSQQYMDFVKENGIRQYTILLDCFPVKLASVLTSSVAMDNSSTDARVCLSSILQCLYT